MNAETRALLAADDEEKIRRELRKLLKAASHKQLRLILVFTASLAEA